LVDLFEFLYIVLKDNNNRFVKDITKLMRIRWNFKMKRCGLNGILCQSVGREINVTSSSTHAWNTVGTQINNVHHYIAQRILS